MKQNALRLGRTAAEKPFTLPAAVVTQTMAIVGIRGSGKTTTATVAVEELLALHHQVVIIDPTDGWWGLKSSEDGEKPGYPVVVLGGPHGDLPLRAEDGDVLADFAVEERVPLVLSLRHLRKGQQRQFVTAFAERLYHRKGEAAHRTPLLVVLDEASAFVPQRVAGDTARMVGSIEDLVRRGRSAGIGVALIDQRPASVNKDVLTQLEVLVAHRITSPQDSKALDDWIRQHDTEGRREEFLAQLSSLPRGGAWFWSPGLDVFERVQVRNRKTFDSSKTPELGEELRLPERVAAVDLDALRSKLAETIAEAEENDPKVLRARLDELERELKQARKGTGAPDPAEIEQRVHSAVAAAEQPLRNRLEQVERKVARAVPLAEQLAAVLRNGSTAPPPTAPVQPATRQAAPAKPAPAPTETKPATATAPLGKLTKAQQAILDAIATLDALGVQHPTNEAVGAVAGYTASGGYYQNQRGSLSSAGLIHYPAENRLALTPAGKRLARARQDIRTLGDFHDAWLSVLKAKAQREILKVLLDVYPRALTNEELAERAGFTATGGYYQNQRGSLSTLGALTYPGPNQVRASDLLFPEGLR